MSVGIRLDAARAAHTSVSESLLDMQELVASTFRPPRDLSGATAGSERAARDRLHRLGCLSLALDRLTDVLDGLDPPAGADGTELARLLTEPCEVRYTSATGDPVRVELLTVEQIVAAAREDAAEIRRTVEAYQAAVRAVDAELDRLGNEIEELRHRTETLGGGARQFDAPRDRLAELRRHAAADPVGCGRPGAWRDAVTRTTEDLAAAGRTLAVVAEHRDRLPARAHRLRSSVDRLRRLAAEATAEGLGNGGDPTAGLAVDGLLDRLAAAETAGRAGRWWDDFHTDPGGATLADALDRAADRADSARRRLRRRCHQELSGRLEAYRQKAADEGRAEDSDLEQSYRDALHGLRPDAFTVTTASRAVRAYQQAVNGGTR